MRYVSGQTKEKPQDYLNPEASVVNEITIDDKPIPQDFIYVVMVKTKLTVLNLL